MAPSHECEAFVLRLEDYRETDRIVSLVTPTHGRVVALARGARRSQKRFGGHLDVLQRVSVGLALPRRGGLATLSDCRLCDGFPPIRADVRRFAAAALLGELALGLSREGAPDAALFAALTTALEAVATAPATTPDHTAALAWHLLDAAGVVPACDACSACGVALGTAGRGAHFDPDHGLLCPACAHRATGGVPLRTADLQALLAWQRGAFGDPTPVASPATAGRAVWSLARATLSRPLRAAAVFAEVCHARLS